MKNKLNLCPLVLFTSASLLLNACSVKNSRGENAPPSQNSAQSTNPPAIASSSPSATPTTTPVPLQFINSVYSASSLGHTTLEFVTGDPLNLKDFEEMGKLTYAQQKITYALSSDTTLVNQTTEDLPNEESFPVYFAGNKSDGVHLIALISKDAAANLKVASVPNANEFTYQTNVRKVCVQYTMQNFTGLGAGMNGKTYSCDTNAGTCVINLGIGNPEPQNISTFENDPNHYSCSASQQLFTPVTRQDHTIVSKVTVAIDENHHSFPVSDDLPTIAGISAPTFTTYTFTEDTLEFNY